ncbi:hypothetical protein PRK78_000245 [Emydomyces testavorans]|uniref:Uncharacterized protein n=1 Tax=Emydomyces testavorans TaxID=2070801 RepID=A0AAF0IE86_9EURO|nr:hypothetical protein PRK78_000245 [Emydomyces testavorans]
MYTYTETNKFLVLLPQAHAAAPLDLTAPPKPPANTTETPAPELIITPAAPKSHRSASTSANMAADEKPLGCGFLKLGP